MITNTLIQHQMLQVSNENHIEGILYIPVYDVFLGYLSTYMMMFFEKSVGTDLSFTFELNLSIS